MSTGRSNGIVVGVVADLDDPDRLGRVRVKFPHLRDTLSDWARIVAPWAGAKRGLHWKPEKDDEVLVLFEHGDPTRPYIVGGMWSMSRTPSGDDGQQTENNWRFLRSRSGHMIKLDDTAGNERIEIVDKDGTREIVIDSAGSKVRVTCDSGDIEVKTGSGSVTVEATTVTIKASQGLTLQAGGEVTIKGATVNIN